MARSSDRASVATARDRGKSNRIRKKKTKKLQILGVLGIERLIGCLPRSRLISQMVTAPGGGKLGIVDSLARFKPGVGAWGSPHHREGGGGSGSESVAEGEKELKPFASRADAQEERGRE